METSASLRHLAVIMDGNGRWARARRLPRALGHRAGAKTLDRVLHWCREAGIRYLTVYAFSTENWSRPADEVSALMRLLSDYIGEKTDELVANRIRFRVVGRRSDLSASLRDEIAALEEKTKGGDFTLVVALSYGGRDEIVRAVRAFCANRAPGEEPTEEALSRCMDAPDVPDPDLIVRTSGELRTSNFLLWQSAYSEYYFTPVLWPDFDRAEFDRALASFAGRERRRGGRPS
jgi:undecaprenyl diphosphate synthase